MTFTLELETYFNVHVTAHPLTKGTLWVKYEPDWEIGPEGEKICSRQVMLDEQMDG